ncbi:unnamed protein product [Bursaphelenchus xylophilus]|uniref:(pine wood nematode) hypothetical protein n=1 Tax=Bursaphelenchus xylophilus TaxID=6326 RepID=A0A1I7S8E3_BURXY|nr:unnamed protein product [Bursaphelenchus xylophilus]CAG9121009.1 unnamed protein product [Bursaphelenchus xylophilus]
MIGLWLYYGLLCRWDHFEWYPKVQFSKPNLLVHIDVEFFYVSDSLSEIIEHYITLRHQFGSAYKSTVRYHAADGVLGLQQGPNIQSPFNNFLRRISAQQFTILTEKIDDPDRKRVLRPPGNLGYITFGEMDTVNCARDHIVAPSVNSSSWNFRINRVLIANFVDQTEFIATVDPAEAFTLVPRQVMLQILSIFGATPIRSNITTYSIRNTENLPTIYIDIAGYQLAWEPQYYMMGKTLAIMLNPRDRVLGEPSWPRRCLTEVSSQAYDQRPQSGSYGACCGLDVAPRLDLDKALLGETKEQGHDRCC